MFTNFFKRKTKKDWRPSKLDIEGSYNNIQVTLTDFPVLQNHLDPLEKKDFYLELNPDFIENLQSQVGNYTEFEKKHAQNFKTFDIKLPKAPVFKVQIDLLAPYTKYYKNEEFHSDIMDAIINAFQINNIKR